MRALNRRGFTLVELMVAIFIFAIVSAAIYGVLTRTQRLARTQAERSIMQANVRTGIGLITSELRELNSLGTLTDILAMSSTSIQYRGMRGLGFVCEVATGSLKVPSGDFWSGYRTPESPRDRLMLFVENNPNSASDDGWTERAISAVATSTCTFGGNTVPAFQLSLGTNLSTDTLAMITLGSPVRTFEQMEIGAVSASGETWLGARSISGGDASLQPVLGPLAPGGVFFQYWSDQAGGTSTSTPSAVRTIRLRLIGRTENIVAAGAGTTAWDRAVDTLTTDIRLRNAP